MFWLPLSKIYFWRKDEFFSGAVRGGRDVELIVLEKREMCVELLLNVWSL